MTELITSLITQIAALSIVLLLAVAALLATLAELAATTRPAHS